MLIAEVGDDRFILVTCSLALDLESALLSSSCRIGDARCIRQALPNIFAPCLCRDASIQFGQALRSIDRFRKYNIGLIEHSPSGESKRLVLPRKVDPASRSGLIRATGMLMYHGNDNPTSTRKICVARIQSGK